VVLTAQDLRAVHTAAAVEHVMTTQAVLVVLAVKVQFVLSGDQVELILQQVQRMYSNVRSLWWLHRR
jgi:hypothetical protein